MTGLLGTLGRLDEAGGSSRGVPNFLLTHPPAADRVARVQEAVAAAPATATATNRDAFERRIDGLVFGDSREQGFVRGADFLHPIMRLAVRFPQGWEIANNAEAVTAQPSDGSMALVMQLLEGGGSPAGAARAAMSRASFTEVDGDTTTINGLSSFVGTFEGTMNNQAVGVRMGVYPLPSGPQGQFVMVAGIAPSQQFSNGRSAFDGSIRSFRALSQAEADRLQPNRVDFYVVRAGETWESIARGPAGGTVRAAALAIMNGADPASQPRAGQRIRIVVGG
jgi:predicted Zn-dependent protease